MTFLISCKPATKSLNSSKNGCFDKTYGTANFIVNFVLTAVSQGFSYLLPSSSTEIVMLSDKFSTLELRIEFCHFNCTLVRFICNNSVVCLLVINSSFIKNTAVY